MTRPPAAAEALLTSLGARADFREPLLGDLAERFALRTERDGAGSARQWYWRETVRAMPHLLGDGTRSLRARDVRHLAGVVFTAYMLAVVIVVVAISLAKGIAEALGLAPLLRPGPVSGVELLSFYIPVGLMCMVLGGYIAARLDRRAPLMSAVALGIAWAVTSLAIGGLTHGNNAPLWYWLVVPLLQVTGPIAGGVLCIRRRQASNIDDGAEAIPRV